MRNWIKTTFVSVSLTLGFVAQAHSDTVLEKILTGVLADRYGYSTDEINRVRTESKYSIFDLGDIFSGSRHMNTTPEKVWRLREEGLGWGQIAHEVGIQPGEFNKMRNAGYFDDDRVWRDAFHQRFGMKDDDYDRMRKSGARIEDICGAAVIGKAKHKDPRSIYEDYKRSHNWDAVCKKQGVKFTDWKKHANKPEREDHGKGTSHGKGNSGQSNGHGNSGGKGRGNSGGGNGHGGGNGKGSAGPGNGKGGGNGKGHGHLSLG